MHVLANGLLSRVHVLAHGLLSRVALTLCVARGARRRDALGQRQIGAVELGFDHGDYA